MDEGGYGGIQFLISRDVGAFSLMLILVGVLTLLEQETEVLELVNFEEFGIVDCDQLGEDDACCVQFIVSELDKLWDF